MTNDLLSLKQKTFYCIISKKRARGLNQPHIYYASFSESSRNTAFKNGTIAQRDMHGPYYEPLIDNTIKTEMTFDEFYQNLFTRYKDLITDDDEYNTEHKQDSFAHSKVNKILSELSLGGEFGVWHLYYHERAKNRSNRVF